MNTPLTNNPSLLNLSDRSTFVLDATTIIGRHEDCNLVLKSERGASRKHARITIENDAAVLMDLGSLNGTMVNGREIGRPVQLSDGDIVVFDEQEYQFISPVFSSAHAGDNVTVIANKDEIGRPESIKPAIRVVDTPAAAPIVQPAEQPVAQSVAQSEMNPIPQPIAQPQHQADSNTTSFDDTEAWEIPATSRPGGDAVTPKRLQEKYRQSHDHKKSRPIWLNWAVIVPLLILVALISFYFAYSAGFTAGTSGDPTGQ